MNACCAKALKLAFLHHTNIFGHEKNVESYCSPFQSIVVAWPGSRKDSARAAGKHKKQSKLGMGHLKKLELLACMHNKKKKRRRRYASSAASHRSSSDTSMEQRRHCNSVNSVSTAGSSTDSSVCESSRSERNRIASGCHHDQDLEIAMDGKICDESKRESEENSDSCVVVSKDQLNALCGERNWAAVSLLYRRKKTLAPAIYGRVELGVLEGKSVVVKCCSASRLRHKGNDVAENPGLEVGYLRALAGHPNILRLLDSFWDEETDEFKTVVEYLSGGDLFNRVQCGGPIPEHEAKLLFRQVAAGVQHCHKNGVAHLDLSLENLLLSAADDSSDEGQGPTVKIADFGMARLVDVSGARFPGKTMQNRAGKVSYMSPEKFSLEAFDGKKADCWAMGSILFTMICGAPPYMRPVAADKWFRVIRRGGVGRLIDASLARMGKKAVSRECVDLVASLMLPENRRFDIHQVATHPWLT